ncbi:MAG: hypothetical protein JRG68_01555 [Deltaproteobacteria bacterium]|nr:hypothetical protein [Deltaproteobacteria bacterium]
MIIRDKFDFEIGYLKRSPCKECKKREDFPACLDECNILDKIRVVLAKGISCTGKSPFVEG